MTDTIMDPATDAAIHAEHSLIAALVVDRDAIASVADRLRPAAFGHPQCRAIYEAALSLWDRRVPGDAQTLGYELVRLGKVREGQIPPWSTITGIAVDYSGFACHAPHYADAVIGFAKQRALAAAGSDVIMRANAGDVSAERAMTALRDHMAAFGDVVDSTPPTYADLMPEVRGDALARWDGSLVERVTPTGFASLDQTLRGGFRPGDVTMLGGRPGMGKTSFMLSLAHVAALRQPDETALIFSLEMSRRSLLERAITGDADVPYGVGYDRSHDVTKQEAWLSASGRLEDLPVAIDDTSRLTTGSMHLRIDRIQHERPVSLVVIDHLDHIGDDIKTTNQAHKISEIMKRIRHLAKACNVPIVLIAQLNRAVEQRGHSFMPHLSDFRDSGAIEQDADVAMLLFRRRYYSERGMLDPDPDQDYFTASPLQKVSLIVAKNRNGEPRTCLLGWDARTMRFQDADGKRMGVAS